MKQQPLTEETLSEAEAIRMVRGLSHPVGRRTQQDADVRRRQACLTDTVQTEVIPRLVSAQRLRRLTEVQSPAKTITEGEVEEVVRLVLTGNLGDAQRYADSMMETGLPAARLLVDLLAPAARRLGDMWCEDACSFADVTTGVLRLANVMRVVGAAMGAERVANAASPRILLFQAPGEQHGFGLAMVACFFRAAGFAVRNETNITAAEALTLVASEWFSLIGISVACTAHLGEVTGLVAALREASRNRDIGVLLGGFAFAGNAASALEAGADLPAMDGPDSIRAAQDLLSRLALEP